MLFLKFNQKVIDSILPWLFLNPALVCFEVFEKEFQLRSPMD